MSDENIGGDMNSSFISTTYNLSYEMWQKLMVFFIFIFFIPNIFLWATKHRQTDEASKGKDKGGKNMSGVGGGDSEVTCQK